MAKYIKTNIKGLFIIEPEIHNDDRGYFFESFNEREFVSETITSIGYCVNFVQDNESKSDKNVLRGLHYQKPPYDQAKLVRVVKGEVYDVAVDLRQDSETYGKWFGVTLSEENKRQFFIPRGFAHGFLVTRGPAIFQYKCDNKYMRSHEGGLQWNDPDIGIEWEVNDDEVILSEKDKTRTAFKDFITPFRTSSDGKRNLEELTERELFDLRETLIRVNGTNDLLFKINDELFNRGIDF